jgi:hypothetical protein
MNHADSQKNVVYNPFLLLQNVLRFNIVKFSALNTLTEICLLFIFCACKHNLEKSYRWIIMNN